jgi:uncharacterized protein YjiS (DUF1127 family)
MDRPLPSLVRARSSAPRPSWGAWLLGLLGCGRSRRRLAELDDRMLRDVGLTREEAGREAGRPVWDVPRHWLR